MKRGAIFVLFSFLFLGCGPQLEKGRMVSVTIEPQRYFAEQIAGDKFLVHTVVPTGQNPETYDPTPVQMVQIGRSEAYLQIGYIGFEQAWMQNIRKNNPDMQVFDLSKGFEFIEGEAEKHGDHYHKGVDPHIWSSIGGARRIATNTMRAFCKLDSVNMAYYRENYERVMAKIDSTEMLLLDMISPLSNRSFIIYHPALTYFAAEFNLTQLCIETDGKDPSPAQLKELIRTARENNVRVVFIQQEFDQKNAALIAKETGCRLVVINPLSYDWSEEMIYITKALADE